MGWLPSLLPGGTIIQGVALGLLATVGYGVGALVAAVVRLLLGRRRVAQVPSWAATLGWSIAIIAAVVALSSGLWMSRGINAQAEQLGVPQYRVNWLLATVVGVLVMLILIAIGRGVRALTRRLADRIGSRVGPRPVALGAASAVTLLGITALLVSGFLLTQEAFNRIDAASSSTPAPDSPNRSGSADSLIAFDTLGKEGRQFVTQGKNQNTIRTYAGLRSAADAQARADLAVADMLRAGGADADVWIGITTTGNGFIDPVAAEAADEVSGGRAALVAIQYSTLPSWLSFLVNQSSARDAGIATYEALAQARDRLPAESRPRLVLYGESLGAFGSPAPFAGMSPQEVVDKIDGALWVGPPAATDPVTEWTYSGAPPLWQPVVDAGATARYAATEAAAEDPPGNQPWSPQRILVLQNPTDPVVWFTPDLVARQAAWLADPRGPGVQPGTRWTPVLFFLQVTMNLPQAVSMPSGYGHDYSDALLTAWRQVLDTSG